MKKIFALLLLSVTLIAVSCTSNPEVHKNGYRDHHRIQKDMRESADK